MSRSEPLTINPAGQSFVTPQATAIWVAITTCWGAEVFIPDLSAGFWKFTLQVCVVKLAPSKTMLTM
jgi:conserved oligomeric Golgi complex subunit 2